MDGTINDSRFTGTVPSNSLLIDFLRQRGLTGTKPSCELEVCGSCTVLLNKNPVSSCTTLTAELDGGSVETIEGLEEAGQLHPIQSAFVTEFAFQCGYCTPGMIMTVKSLLEVNSNPSREDIIHWLDGNICRCTGYESIIRATQKAAEILSGASVVTETGKTDSSKVQIDDK